MPYAKSFSRDQSLIPAIGLQLSLSKLLYAPIPPPFTGEAFSDEEGGGVSSPTSEETVDAVELEHLGDLGCGGRRSPAPVDESDESVG